MKTNLIIQKREDGPQYRPQGENDFGGEWMVIGKLTGYIYFTGKKSDCMEMLKISNWENEEIELNECREMEEYYSENYDPEY